jgi:isopentenyldiphosphate isomerase/intracellular septation protein A
MNRNQLIKILLPGLLPLIVFILVDEFYGMTAGLMVAVAFGAGQLLYSYLKDSVIDTFVLFDTLLIVALGGVSLLLENEVFFKLKPAVIGAILCVLLGISAFSPMNLLVMMSKRYVKDMHISDTQAQQMTRSARVLFMLFTAHTVLVIYAALFMSTEAWAFISTVLLYLLFGAYTVYELGKNWLQRRRYQREEWLPLVDEKGTVIGKAPRSIVHSNAEMLHPVVHLHVINERKELFLQKRRMTKKAFPGKWDTSVGGHVAFGETIETALSRESAEEIGLREFTPVPVGHYVSRQENDSELVFVFYTRYSGPLTIDRNEIDDGRFWTQAEIAAGSADGSFTPSVVTEFAMLKKLRIV